MSRLTEAEAAELDAFGTLSWLRPMPKRAQELWEREILHGSDKPNLPLPNGILPPR